jgi:hypothetical protein
LRATVEEAVGVPRPFRGAKIWACFVIRSILWRSKSLTVACRESRDISGVS